MTLSKGLKNNDLSTNNHERKMEPKVEEDETIRLPNANTLEAPLFIRGLEPQERERRENALRRKIDLRLLPTIVLMYILNYLDRNNIAVARLAGLERDLQLTSGKYIVSPNSGARRSV